MWIALSFLLGLGLAMDCFALSLSDGLAYRDLTKKKGVFIATVFGLMQGLMPLLGYLLGLALAQWIDAFDHYVSFVLLAFIGIKMMVEGIRGMVKPEACEAKKFSVPEVLLQGVADSIDALAIGITIQATIGATVDYQIYVSFVIIALMSFLLSIIGLVLGRYINCLLKGRFHVAEVLGGLILLGLGIYLLVSGIMEAPVLISILNL